jgi:uncharacterized caspase-like protein
MMISCIRRTLFALLLLLVPIAAAASVPEKRLALVIGNSAYKAGALVTPANDASLVADALRTQGFDVTGSRDLDIKRLRQTVDEFRNKVQTSGPGSVVAIYFAGLGLQLEGDNYLLPIDMVPTQTSDIRRDGLQLSSLTRSLAELSPKAAFVIVDAARKNPFSMADGPLASGFAWVEPEVNVLVALNAAPGTIASDKEASFGPYAVALAGLIREDGLSPDNVFSRLKLKVNEATSGGQVPWHNARIEKSFVLAEHPSDARQPTEAPELARPVRPPPMRTLSPSDAYFTALIRDTFDGYSEFLAEYWKDPMTSRVRALLAARREVLTWHRSTQEGTANAYWTYLERYPHGPHLAEAQRWLTHAGAAVAPPAKFARMECDVPAPLPDELEYIEHAPLNFGDMAAAFQPLQPIPEYFLSASVTESRRLAVPDGPAGDHDLPALAPASPAKPAAPVAAAPLLPTEAEQPHEVDAASGDTANSTTSLPPSARPVPRSSTAAAPIATPAAPTMAAIPWVGGAPNYQPVTPPADTQRQTTPPAPSASNANPVWDTQSQPPRPDANARPSAVRPSNRVLSVGAIPLPSPRPVQRTPQAVPLALRSANPAVPRPVIAVAPHGPAASARAPGLAPQPSPKPRPDAPTATSAPIVTPGSPIVARTVRSNHPLAPAGQPAAQPARKPAAAALSAKPAAIAPTN